MSTTTNTLKSLSALAFAGAVAVSSLACAGSHDTASAAPAASISQPKSNDRIRPEYDNTGKLQKLEYDRDNDGKVDTYGYMDGTRVVRVEVDQNADGKIDLWEFHRAQDAAAAPGAAPQTVDKTIERIERATKFDGKVSRWEYFTGGTLSEIEEDTDSDGKVDKWETYADGSLSVMAFDSQKRGTPDRRLVYRPDGSLDHIEADPTGSGTFTPLQP